MIAGSVILLFTLTSSSDHFRRSDIISAGIVGCIRFSHLKRRVWSFSQIKLSGELFVALFESGLLTFLPICASNGVFFVIPRGVICNIFRLLLLSDSI